MNCIKCGREIALGQVFCKECLAYMEQHPVNPDTPVVLPNRSAVAASRRASYSRKNLKPEERVARLRRLVFIQTLALLAVMVAFVLTVMVMYDKLTTSNTVPLPGQNYSTVENTSGD